MIKRTEIARCGKIFLFRVDSESGRKSYMVDYVGKHCAFSYDKLKDAIAQYEWLKEKEGIS